MNNICCALTRETSHTPSFLSGNVFAAFFVKVFRLNDHLPHLCLPNYTTDMKDFHITAEAVAAIIVQLDPHKSACPDD